ncbi:aquaporin-4-like isoform X2 [Mauremys mutica]|uniref:aquaporin-4-like isoform X2 n=1 Tax=Mauremys mutica TaxID=74926 RepID=UPI001D167BC7|nr:aquaporin-4-like isoform X2 [Mauremys mutica]
MAIGEELRSRRFWRSLLAEAAATLIFVWLVLGASCPGGPGRVTAPPALQPALTAGLAAVGLAHCFGEVSGAQANPALTLAFLCTRKLDALRGAAYVLAQCLGAILASAAVYLALPAAAASHLVTRGTFSGGSMNPARSLGPAVLTGIWDHHWVYWIGPSLGAVLAGLSYEFLFASSASREKLVACLTCRDIDIVETASVSRSSLSTAPQDAARAKPPPKGEPR